VTKCTFQGSLGPKISRRSQNRQKYWKSQSKPDQKVVKSPIKNQSKCIWRSQKSILLVPQKHQKCHFSTWWGSKSVKMVKNWQILKPLHKNVRKTVIAKSKARVFIKFDDFSKIQHATKIQKSVKTMKTIKKCQNGIFRRVLEAEKP